MFGTSSRFRFLESAVERSFLAVVLCGCGAGVITRRSVDEPYGYTKTYGAPKSTTYTVQSQASRYRLHISILQQSECDVYKTRLISRTRETLSDGEVIGREASTLVQIVEEKEGVIACEKSYASGLDVHLRVGNTTYRLGKTSVKGELHIAIADLLKRNLYKANDASTQDAIVLVQPRGAEALQEAGTISLAHLSEYEKRIEALLVEFRQLLEKGEGKMSYEEIGRSYEIYEKLDEINVRDERIDALHTRFLELFYGRKENEATASPSRNFEALVKAKNVLASIAKAADQRIPKYVSVAIQQNDPTDQALSWARGRLVTGIRQDPELCGPPSGAFTWNWFNQRSWPLATELALALLHYAFDDPYQQKIQELCKTSDR